jgi:hypothetical protein
MSIFMSGFSASNAFFSPSAVATLVDYVDIVGRVTGSAAKTGMESGVLRARPAAISRAERLMVGNVILVLPFPAEVAGRLVCGLLSLPTCLSGT